MRVQNTMRSLFRSRPFRWVGLRKEQTGIILGAIALVESFRDPTGPVDLLDPGSSPQTWLVWGLLLAGIAIRIWAAGNLHKGGGEITRTGIYAIVKHPLYLGTSLMYFAYFLAFWDDILVFPLFAGLLVFVYYPKMLHEEEWLAREFPSDFARYRALPRLIPDVRRLRDALASDCFSWRRAYQNHGLTSLWMTLALPLLFDTVSTLKTLL